jgi:hypothetical protein
MNHKNIFTISTYMPTSNQSPFHPRVGRVNFSRVVFLGEVLEERLGITQTLDN